MSLSRIFTVFFCLAFLTSLSFAEEIQTSEAADSKEKSRRYGNLSEHCYEVLHDEDLRGSEEEKLCRDEVLKIVVSATGAEKALSDAPASIAVITEKEIQRKGASSIADIVRDTPGVQVSDSGQAGLQRIRIRGEDSTRVSIMIDGQEFLDHRGVGTPVLIAPDMIERIEVLRGAGSVLYGGRAVGGVINIITKKGGYHPLQASASALYDSSTNGQQYFASLHGKSDGFSYRAAGTFSDHGDRDTAEGELENTSYDNQSFYGYLAKEFGKHNIGLQYENYNASSKVHVEEEVRTHPPFQDFKIDAPKRDRNKAALFYDWQNQDGFVSKVHVDAYRQESEREFNTFSDLLFNFGFPLNTKSDIYTDSTLLTYGANAKVEMTPHDDHYLVAGLQYMDDDLKQNRLRQVMTNGVSKPDESTFDKANQETFALFALDTWSMSENWELVFGGRGYWVSSELEETDTEGLEPNSNSDSHAVGTAALSYTGMAGSTIWARFSQGYVYPSLLQAGVGAFAGPDFVNPNPDLDPETSNNFEIGFRTEDNGWLVDTALFYTEAQDYINHVLCSASDASCIEPEGTRDRVYDNVDEAKTFGAELLVEKDIEEFTPYTKLTWLRREFTHDGMSTYDTGLPSISSRTGIKYEKPLESNINLWVDLFVRADSDADEVDGTDVQHTPGWATTNLAFGLDFGDKKQYRAGVNLLNLGDKAYRPSTENLLARGRSAILSISGTFG